MKEYESRKEMLADLVPKGSVIAEIGVFAGDFSEWILKTLTPKTFYAVDPYVSTIGVMGSGNEHGYNMQYYDLNLLFGFVKHRLEVYPGVKMRREFSHPFFESVPDGSLDAVYIDGDHSFEAVRSDLEDARFAVKEGGWIFGHDYALHPEKGNPEIKHMTKTVVDEFCAKYGLTVYALANDGIQSFAIKNEKKYKICIVSVSDRQELYGRTFPLFQSYAQTHGYQLRLYLEALDKERHPSWSKIPALRLTLQEGCFDYVVWMDDDIVITNPEIPLSHFIDQYGFRKSQACILVSGDIPSEPSTWMNCGIFFTKQEHPKLIPILDAAWRYGDLCQLTRQNYSWEQEAFNFLYRFTDRENFKIVPLPNFQTTARFHIDSPAVWTPGSFAIHLNNGPLPIKLQTYELLKRLCPHLP